MGDPCTQTTYGDHMATHMAIGFLFLGLGRYTLSTSNTAIGALVCALYPHFPVSPLDNRYHMQVRRMCAPLLFFFPAPFHCCLVTPCPGAPASIRPRC